MNGPNDSGNSRTIFLASFLTIFAAGVGFAVRGAILNDWADQYGFTKTDLGTITGGGLVGFGHPVGATGVKQALEIFRQAKGLCGDYQMKTPPRVGVSANMGGDDRTAVVTVYRQPG